MSEKEKKFPERVSILGVPIDPYTMDETVDKAEWYVEERKFAHFIGVNADKILQMKDAPEIDAIVRRCEVISADGASMLIASKKLGVYLPERVAGVDFMDTLCARAEEKGYSVYLLGATADVVAETSKALHEKYPQLHINGFRDGYFDESEFKDIAAEVGRAHANIVFVGITSPKKEKLIEYFRACGIPGVFVGVGGTFDVISGNIPRAPLWMQNAKLEWFFRFLQEPKRLARRYAVGNARFLWMLYRESKKQRLSGR